MYTVNYSAPSEVLYKEELIFGSSDLSKKAFDKCSARLQEVAAFDSLIRVINLRNDSLREFNA